MLWLSSAVDKKVCFFLGLRIEGPQRMVVKFLDTEVYLMKGFRFGEMQELRREKG